MSFSAILECPVATPEDGNDLASFADGVDVHGVAADHKVLVDHRVVDAQLAALFVGLVVAVTDGVVEATAHGQVGDGILIEQGVVEQQVGLVDGAGLGNQSA